VEKEELRSLCGMETEDDLIVIKHKNFPFYYISED